MKISISASAMSRTALPSPRRNASKAAAVASRFCSTLLIDLEHGQERLLGHLDRSHLLHPLLALLLLLQQLALAGDVASVELRGHVLAQRLDRLARQHARSDRRLHRHVEELAGDRLLQSLDQ